MRKKTTTLFLLLVLSIQMLPVQQMGSALFSNQFTEEIPHSLDTDKDFAKKGGCPNDFMYTGVLALHLNSIFLPLQHPFVADIILHNYTGEVAVPPPNC